MYALLHELESNDNFLNRIRVPKLTGKELLASNLVAAAFVIDSEWYVFKELSAQLTPMIERSVYNRRRRWFEEFRQAIARQVVALSAHHIFDREEYRIGSLLTSIINNSALIFSFHIDSL